MTWRSVRIPRTRTPWVVCSFCRARELNESNALHRAGWQEHPGRPRYFRCGACAAAGRDTLPARVPRPSSPSPIVCDDFRGHQTRGHVLEGGAWRCLICEPRAELQPVAGEARPARPPEVTS